jgi:hypothetical protein
MFWLGSKVVVEIWALPEVEIMAILGVGVHGMQPIEKECRQDGVMPVVGSALPGVMVMQ